MNRRKVALAITLSGVTIATQAMACDSARAASEASCQARIDEQKALAEFQARIRGKPTVHLQP